MTQKMKVLNYLQKNQGITSMEAFSKLKITRLSARIYDLKAQGYKISKIREHHTNEQGETSSYDRYFVDNLDDMVEANMNHIPNIL